MPSGYEDWLSFRVRDPATALARLYKHMEYLQVLATVGSVAADGVSESQAQAVALIAPGSFYVREANRLEGVVNGMGVPTLQPTRRVDGGTLCAPDTGFSST